MKTPFDINEFINDDEDYPVDFPKVVVSMFTNHWIKINPDPEKVIQNVNLLLYQEKWSLVSNEVANKNRRDRDLWRGDLHEAVRLDGLSFLFPVTYPRSDSGYYDSQLKAIKSAHRYWTKLTANRDEKYFEIEVDKKNKQSYSWQELDMETLLEIAFQGRIILPGQPLKSSRSHRVYEED